MTLPNTGPSSRLGGRAESDQHLLSPPWLTAPVGLCLLFLLVPLLGVVVRADWAHFPQLLSSDAAVDALWLSAKTCVAATAVCMLLGLPMAYWLAANTDAPGWRGRAAQVLRVCVTVPLVLPPVVAGLAMLIVYGKRGPIGGALEAMGISIAFSTTAVIMAQVFVAMPYLVVSLEGALRTRGFRLERAARQLGASRTRTLFSITLPLSAPAIASGTALALARALGEFGATITFAGSLQGTTRTLPLQIYLQRESDQAEALALAIVLIVFAGVLLFISNYVTGRWQARLFPAAPPEDHTSTSGPTVEVPDAPPSPMEARATAPEIRVDAEVAERGLSYDATIPAGRMTAVLGPNGSGKSTLVGLLTGMLRPSAGGVAFRLPSMDEAGVEPHIVSLTQHADLFPHMDVRTNVAFGLRARGASRTSAEARADAELAALGASQLADRPASLLSGGQAQRVAIARALALDPDVIALDEPMASLDVEVADGLRDLLAGRLADVGATGVLVTHDAADVAALADHVLVLDGGRVVESGEWREVLEGSRSPFIGRLSGRFPLTVDGRTRMVSARHLRLVPPGEGLLDGIAVHPTWDADSPAWVIRTTEGQRVTVISPDVRSESAGSSLNRLCAGDRCGIVFTEALTSN